MQTEDGEAPRVPDSFEIEDGKDDWLHLQCSQSMFTALNPSLDQRWCSQR
jgi:hypothetical protein